MRPARYFRAGAGAVIVNTRGRVLAFERANVPGAWQFPQGGLDLGETPVQAMFREVREETGLTRRHVRLLDQHPTLLVYELPRRSQSKKTGLGQVQYWFYLAWKGDPDAVPEPPADEFRAAAWMTPAQVIRRAVPFRRPVYRELARHLPRARRARQAGG
jgi:putative (di)nucleoside polyphosphate hydrolase